MTVEQAGKVATSTIDAMKSQPLAIALILINIIFLGFGLWFVSDVVKVASERTKRADELLSQLVKSCTLQPKKEND